MSNKISIGDKIPPFELKDENGNTVQSDDLIGNGPLVLYFYPKDETRGCIAEACAFRDDFESFEDLGARVIGISSDTPESHKSFKENHRLPFTLLSDPGGKVRKEFGVPRSMLGLIPGRVTYVVNQQGEVRHIFNSMTQFDQHVEEALNVVREMKE